LFAVAHLTAEELNFTMSASAIGTGMVVASSLSIVSSLALCIYLVRSSKLERVSYKIIFLVTLCDAFSATGTVFGLTKGGSFECWAQSMFTQIFPLASAWWMVLIGLHVMCTIRAIPIDPTKFFGKYAFLVCFGIPILVTLLPFTTSTYGCLEDEDPCWCFVKEVGSSPEWSVTVWYIVAFYMWIWLSLFFNVSLIIYSMMAVRYISHDVYKERIRDILIKLLGYPMVIIVCWACVTIYDLVLVLNPTSGLLLNDTFLIASYTLPCLQGFLTSCVFVLSHWNARKYFGMESKIHSITTVVVKESSVAMDPAYHNDDGSIYDKVPHRLQDSRSGQW
jgi:hypothetical protein